MGCSLNSIVEHRIRSFLEFFSRPGDVPNESSLVVRHETAGVGCRICGDNRIACSKK